ncbi:Lipoprotein lpqE [Kibdelosporangium sp. 4NS15]|uniref:Lipoprotein lpqE n=1 Tax=Kibdelosporangium persicum TaxID=2698649 RepID=A0ABX2F4N1_9PSEU|nr:hypothetical protein [Kibdelosporangium persicum]NRN66138.1 Lipoprotein lpqE [Kibdelosporangium persicum]
MSRQRHSLRFATAAVGIALALAGCGAGQISQTAGMEAAVNGGQGNVGSIAVRDVQLAYPPRGVYQAGSDAVLIGTIVNSGQTDDELISITSPAGQVRISGDRNLPAGRSLIFEAPAGGVAATPSSTSSAPTTTGSSTPGSATSGVPTSGSVTSGSPTSGSAPGSVSGSATSGPATTTTTPRTTGGADAARPATIGKITGILTDIAEEIRSGKTIELTFTFRSGSTTIQVPIAVPTTPRQAPAGGGGGGH